MSQRTEAPPKAESSGGDRARGGMAHAAAATRQLQQLTGSEVEGVTGLHRNDDGWVVEVDGDGGLMGYRRRRRYARGEVGDD